MKNLKQYIPENSETTSFSNAVTFEVPIAEIKTVVGNLYANKNLVLKLITATDERDTESFKIWYIFGVLQENKFIIPFIQLKNTNEFPSVTAKIHEAWDYEKKIKTFFGLTPVGHPDSRPLILQENWPTDVFPLRKDFNWQTRPGKAQGQYPFQKVKGEGVYEIPVGPIHAGIIEPGHFRFSVAGEEILLLERRLGFTHKGSEKLFETLPLSDKVHLSEKISGDSSFSHSLAFCQGLERLSNITVSSRAVYLRVVYAELERLANHFGDIGAIMLDSGFNFGGANGARLREMIMRINARLTGSRFLRGVNQIGGVSKDIGLQENNALLKELKKITNDFSEIISVAENSTTLLNRLKGTGILSPKIAKEHGVVGITARASGIQNDARLLFPYAAYAELPFQAAVPELDGDVYARFRMRVKEVYSSLELIQQALRQLPEGSLNEDNKIVFKKNAFVVSIVEGWRGEIVYFITTDKQGNISRVALRDPSFVNWSVLGYACLNNIVPDFPLINKSFNLSYSGNDL